MLARILNYLFTSTALGRYLDGKKSWISAGLLALAALLEFIEQLIKIFPDYVPLAVGAEELAEFLDAAVSTLTTIGFGGLTVGVAHKVAKKKLQ